MVNLRKFLRKNLKDLAILVSVGAAGIAFYSVKNELATAKVYPIGWYDFTGDGKKDPIVTVRDISFPWKNEETFTTGYVDAKEVAGQNIPYSIWRFQLNPIPSIDNRTDSDLGKRKSFTMCDADGDGTLDEVYRYGITQDVNLVTLTTDAFHKRGASKSYEFVESPRGWAHVNPFDRLNPPINQFSPPPFESLSDSPKSAGGTCVGDMTRDGALTPEDYTVTITLFNLGHTDPSDYGLSIHPVVGDRITKWDLIKLEHMVFGHPLPSDFPVQKK